MQSLTRLLGGCFALAFIAACGAVTSPSDSPTGKQKTALANGPALRWFYTCGNPVCEVQEGTSNTSGGLPACDTERAGDTCDSAGAMCDPGVGCGVRLLCTDHDPTAHGCPISRGEYKRGISYLTSERLEGVAREVQDIKLATYQYKESMGDGKKHLGFIIDDNPTGPAVDSTRQHVDLYAYTSMLVAAVQVQAKEIESLKQQVASLLPNPRSGLCRKGVAE